MRGKVDIFLFPILHWATKQKQKSLTHSAVSSFTQCTVGQAMEIGSFKNFKSKGLVFAQFWSKSENSSSDWWTTDQILKEKYSHHIFAKKRGIYWQETWRGCQTTLKFGMQKGFVVLWKKPENNVLVPGPVHCENGFKVWKLKFSWFFQFLLKGFKQNSIN